jgi:hypothetical protein
MEMTLAVAGVALAMVPGTASASSLAGATLAGGAVMALLGGLALWVRRATSASDPRVGAVRRRRTPEAIRPARTER